MKSLFTLFSCFLFMLTISAFTDYHDAPPYVESSYQLLSGICPDPANTGSSLNVNNTRDLSKYGPKVNSNFPTTGTVGPNDNLQQKIDALCPSGDCTGKTLYLRTGEYFVSDLKLKKGLRIIGQKKNTSTGPANEVIFLGTQRLNSGWTKLPNPVGNNLYRYKYNSSITKPSPTNDVCDPGLPSEYQTCNYKQDLFLGAAWGTQVDNENDVNADREWTFSDGTIYLCSKVSPNNLDIQLSSKERAFAKPNIPLNEQPSDVKIYNVVFRGYINEGITAYHGWKIYDCRFLDCHQSGISIAGDNVEVTGCEFFRNGQAGILISRYSFSLSGTTNVLISTNFLKANNQAGYDIDGSTGKGAGLKSTRATNLTLSYNYVLNNNGPGLWCDVFSTRDILEYNLIESNGSDQNENGRIYNLRKSTTKHDGITYELSKGANNSNRSMIRHNITINGDYGVLMRSSAYVDVYRNTIKNAQNGIVVWEDDRGEDASYIKVTYNKITQNNSPRPAGIRFTGTNGPHNIGWFYSSSANIEFNYNIYYNSSPNDSDPNPPRFYWNLNSDNFLCFTSCAPYGGNNKNVRDDYWQKFQDKNSCIQPYENLITRQDNANLKKLIEPLPELKDKKVVKPYPNSFNERLHVLLPDSMEQEYLQIKLTDLSGRTYPISKDKLHFTQQALEIQTDNLPTGVYILSIEEGNQRHHMRVIKE